MFRIFDVQCLDCGSIQEQMLGRDEEWSPCKECGSFNMSKIFTTMNFKLNYTPSKDICAWGDSNYETSQYWRKVNEARARGENVKSPDDKY